MKEVYLRNKNGEYLSFFNRKVILTVNEPIPLQTPYQEGQLSEEDKVNDERSILQLAGSYLIFKGDGAAICRAVYGAEGTSAHLTILIKADEGTTTGQLSFTSCVDKYGLDNQFEVMCYWVESFADDEQK